MKQTRRSPRAAFAVFTVAALLPLTAAPVIVQAKGTQDVKTAEAAAIPAPPIMVMVDGVKVPLADGTHIKLQLTEELASNKSKTGEQVHYVVDEDVMDVDKKVLIRKGAPAVGTITRAKGRRGLGRGGKLDFTCESVTAVDGSQIPLRGNESTTGKSTKGSMIAVGILLSPLGSLFMKGHDIIVKQGTVVTAHANGAPVVASTK